MNKNHFDQHIHSAFSCDSKPENTIGHIAESAISAGLSGIAITDHFDPLWPDETPFGDFEYFELDIPAYQAALTEAENIYSDRILFSKGIELGLLSGKANDKCLKVVRGFPYDFVIGSVHYSETTPIDYTPFHEGRLLPDILDEYYGIIIDSIKEFKDYDVLGHINSIDRYTDELAPGSLYMSYIDEIIKLVISDGKGIEINTCSYGRYYRPGEYGTPTLAILKRFRELGGEIVTIGSDAHKTEDVGAFIEKGEDLLHSAGFKYQAVFKERKPEFCKI